MDSVTIRAADVDDVPTILRFILELAEFERLSDQVVASEEAVRRTLFGEHPFAEVLIAEESGRPAGFALFYHNYSTFLARPGIYLEDLYVTPASRRRGVGRLLLSRLAAIAVERGCGRFEWAVLNWNVDARRFYEHLGAVPLSDWTTYRVTGEPLRALANGLTGDARVDDGQG